MSPTCPQWPRLARTASTRGMQTKAHRSRVRTWHATVLLLLTDLPTAGTVRSYRAPWPPSHLDHPSAWGAGPRKIQAAACGRRGMPRGPSQCRGGKRLFTRPQLHAGGFCSCSWSRRRSIEELDDQCHAPETLVPNSRELQLQRDPFHTRSLKSLGRLCTVAGESAA
jgi:hypothetical protein